MLTSSAPSRQYLEAVYDLSTGLMERFLKWQEELIAVAKS